MWIDSQGDRYTVKNGNDIIAGPFKTNAEAWRWIDRAQGEPINKQEDRAEYYWRQSTGDFQ